MRQNEKMAEGYDEEGCITAGELRANGCDVAANIPDVAWVPRTACKISKLLKLSRRPDGTFDIQVEVEIEQPFKWFEAKFNIVL